MNPSLRFLPFALTCMLYAMSAIAQDPLRNSGVDTHSNSAAQSDGFSRNGTSDPFSNPPSDSFNDATDPSAIGVPAQSEAPSAQRSTICPPDPITGLSPAHCTSQAPGEAKDELGTAKHEPQFTPLADPNRALPGSSADTLLNETRDNVPGTAGVPDPPAAPH